MLHFIVGFFYGPPPLQTPYNKIRVKETENDTSQSIRDR